jgi:hypothetical protein
VNEKAPLSPDSGRHRQIVRGPPVNLQATASCSERGGLAPEIASRGMVITLAWGASAAKS